MQLALMIEGQNGLDWPRWQRIAKEVERLGFAGLYRSDHYTNPQPPEKDSLELWLSLMWLAEHTRNLRFGPIVSPVTFRHPALSARMALQVDTLSGGRLTLGLGAGWQEREHTMFGMPLLDMRQRFDRFEEALNVITRLIRDDHPVTFEGHYYQLRDAVLLPRTRWTRRADSGGATTDRDATKTESGAATTDRDATKKESDAATTDRDATKTESGAETTDSGGTTTPILIGGNGEKRTLPLVARFAEEWNAVMIAPARFKELNALLDRLIESNHRAPASVRRSMMQGITYGTSPAHLQQALEWRAATWSSRATVDEMRLRGEVVGVGEEVVPQIAAYEEAGVQCLMLQWLPLDDIEALQHFATAATRWLHPA